MGIDAQLRSLSQKLAADASPLHALPKFEKKLNALHLGIELFLADSPFSADPKATKYRQNKHGKKVKCCPAWILGYTKLAGEGWGVVVRPVLVGSAAPGEKIKPDDVPYQAPPSRLHRAPRHVQLGAVELLPKLLEEIRKRVHTTVRSIQWARLLPEAVAKAHHPAYPESDR